MDTLTLLENVYNSHPRESNRLLEICDGDLYLLHRWYWFHRKKFIVEMPADKSEMIKLLLR